MKFEFNWRRCLKMFMDGWMTDTGVISKLIAFVSDELKTLQIRKNSSPPFLPCMVS